jgi:hypothetical protein
MYRGLAPPKFTPVPGVPQFNPADLVNSAADHNVLHRIIFDIFLDLTILIDYFILKKGVLHEDNGHK